MALKKKTKTSKGVNVRISDEGHKVLKAFADNNAYNLGAFVEKAALEKVQQLSTENL